ncbi:MAG: hypothetical protein WD066_16945 [Planctomycetaceae bacterium]
MQANQPPSPLSPLSGFVLGRLLAGGKVTRSVLDQALRRYFANRLGLGDGEWRTSLDRTLDELQQCGLIERKPFGMTAAGETSALAWLGLSSRPVKLGWAAIVNRHVIAKALAIDPTNKAQLDRLTKADHLRAAVLRKSFDLPCDPVPTLSQALNALAWNQLTAAWKGDVPKGADFTRKRVLQVVLCDGRNVDPAKHVPARITGARNTSPAELRTAVTCRWLDALDAVTPPSIEYADSDSPPHAPPFDLSVFARRIIDVARASDTGWFGDNKVFVSHVWNRFRHEGNGAGMTRDGFDRHLVDANRKSLLTLSRADLVSAMNPDDVRDSEIRWSNSTFHFIRIDD